MRIAGENRHRHHRQAADQRACDRDKFERTADRPEHESEGHAHLS